MEADTSRAAHGRWRRFCVVIALGEPRKSHLPPLGRKCVMDAGGVCAGGLGRTTSARRQNRRGASVSAGESHQALRGRGGSKLEQNGIRKGLWAQGGRKARRSGCGRRPSSEKTAEGYRRLADGAAVRARGEGRENELINRGREAARGRASGCVVFAVGKKVAANSGRQGASRRGGADRRHQRAWGTSSNDHLDSVLPGVGHRPSAKPSNFAGSTSAAGRRRGRGRQRSSEDGSRSGSVRAAQLQTVRHRRRVGPRRRRTGWKEEREPRAGDWVRGGRQISKGPSVPGEKEARVLGRAA